jgi:hypothetical protein
MQMAVITKQTIGTCALVSSPASYLAIYPSVMVRFKFQLLPKVMSFKFNAHYGAVHGLAAYEESIVCTVNQGWN